MKMAWLKVEDVLEVVGLLERAFQEMDFAGRGERFDAATVRARVEEALRQERFFCWCAWRRGVLVGVAALALVPSLTCAAQVKALECVWHSDPRLPALTRGRVMVRLLDVMQRGARALGAQSLHVGCPPVAAVAELLQRRGFVGWETVYRKELYGS